MPTYEYECEQGHSFETRQGIDEEPLETCEIDQCQAPVERQIGIGGGLLFKGPGFYATDYRDSPDSSKDRKGRSR